MIFKQLTVLTGNSVSHLSNVISFLGGGVVTERGHQAEAGDHHTVTINHDRRAGFRGR